MNVLFSHIQYINNLSPKKEEMKDTNKNLFIRKAYKKIYTGEWRKINI